MSTEEKIQRVASVQPSYGLADALDALDLPRSTWYYHQNQKVDYQQKYAHVRPMLEAILRKHPDYGIPRITPELRQAYGEPINHKVVQRLLQLWDLSLLRNAQPPRPSAVQEVIRAAGKQTNLLASLESIGLFEVLTTDFTELRYAQGHRKAFLMPILGHVSKLVVGWSVGVEANTSLALKAWKMAKRTLKALGVPIEEMILHHDQDSVYTSHEWTSTLLLTDRLRLSYTQRGAADNPGMESFHGRFKTEGRSLFLDAASLGELKRVVSQRIDYHNEERRHSSLGNVAPMDYIQQHGFAKVGVSRSS